MWKEGVEKQAKILEGLDNNVEHVFEVILERDPDGRYYGYCPDLPGCRTWGHTETETLQYMQEAIELYVEDLIADGKPIPGLGMVKNIKPVVRVKEIKEAVR